MDKQAVSEGIKGSWHALPMGRSNEKSHIVVFSFITERDERPDRFAVQACKCGKPMTEFVPPGYSLDFPGAAPHEAEGCGWVIWCDHCDIHAGPHMDRERVIEEWNQLVESLRVLDEL
jgi:hypothetical protein